MQGTTLATSSFNLNPFSFNFGTRIPNFSSCCWPVSRIVVRQEADFLPSYRENAQRNGKRKVFTPVSAAQAKIAHYGSPSGLLAWSAISVFRPPPRSPLNIDLNFKGILSSQWWMAFVSTGNHSPPFTLRNPFQSISSSPQAPRHCPDPPSPHSTFLPSFLHPPYFIMPSPTSETVPDHHCTNVPHSSLDVVTSKILQHRHLLLPPLSSRSTFTARPVVKHLIDWDRTSCFLLGAKLLCFSQLFWLCYWGG